MTARQTASSMGARAGRLASGCGPVGRSHLCYADPMSRCVFCAILAGDLPSSRVYEDDRVVAFLDIHPIRPGHTLVVPRTHALRLGELDPELRAHLWQTGVELADDLRAALPAQDVHFVVNDGPSAFQTVPHVHLHLVPRRPGDGLRLLARLVNHVLPTPPMPRDTLDELAARIRAVRSR